MQRMTLRGRLARLVLAGWALLMISQAAMADDLSGTWNFTFYSDQGEHPRQFVLTQSGDRMDGRLGEETFTGTYKAGELKLAGEHYAAEAGYTSVMRISGKIVDGKLKGTATWGDYDLTFTAVKSTE